MVPARRPPPPPLGRPCTTHSIIIHHLLLAGGGLAPHCACEMGVHGSCLARALLSGEAAAAAGACCELCAAPWQGSVTVDVADLAAAAAALRHDLRPGATQLAAVQGQLEQAAQRAAEAELEVRPAWPSGARPDPVTVPSAAEKACSPPLVCSSLRHAPLSQTPTQSACGRARSRGGSRQRR